MAKKKEIKAVSINDSLIASLKDPQVAALYVSGCIEEKTKHRIPLLLQAMMDVAKAKRAWGSC